MGRPTSMWQAAREAGLSRHQMRQALRVARIPEAEFEALIESKGVPTVTQLAERGKQIGTGRPRSFRSRVKRSLYLERADPHAIDQAARDAGMSTVAWLREAALAMLHATTPLELRPTGGRASRWAPSRTR